MRNFILNETKIRQSYILNLEPDELVLESITNFVKDNGIKNAYIASGVGTLKRLSYHRVMNTNPLPTNEYLIVEGPIELAALQGLIINYEPHIHFVASDLEKTYSGHLENDSVVLYLAEILIVPLEDKDLKRVIANNKVAYIE